jgi:hypothetical protein
MGLLVTLAGCNPVLTPVQQQQPIALTTTANTPRVVWVMDSSGSIAQPVNPQSPDCPAGCGPSGGACPTACATRKSELLAGLTNFSSLPGNVLHSAIIYPGDNSCGGPTSIQENLALADVINAYAQHLPVGGTPTAFALEYAAAQPAPAATETFVVLVTDGLPNCNATNPNNTCTDGSLSQITACRCTTSSCGPGSALCAKGCVDDLGTFNAAQTLADTGAELMVVGVGEELANASGTLSSMKLGLPHTCSTPSDCPGSTCGADGLCSNRLYLGSLAGDYRAPANRLNAAVRQSAACTFWLDRDVLAQNLTLTREGVAVPAAEWTLVGTRQLKTSGATCSALLAGGAAPQVSSLPLLQ